MHPISEHEGVPPCPSWNEIPVHGRGPSGGKPVDFEPQKTKTTSGFDAQAVFVSLAFVSLAFVSLAFVSLAFVALAFVALAC
jgi:hypothetical protein